jgi:ubiquinone biosynthesis protein
MLSLHPKYLKRYKDIALLLFRHEQRELLHFLGLDRFLENGKKPKEPSRQVGAKEMVADLEKLGPTFVKLGQLLSTRSDMLPDEYLSALARLQDNVSPMPIETVETIVREELGKDIGTLFERFEREPLASASLGQVHRARLWNGLEVVVKVQRPKVHEEVHTDLEVLGQLADFIDKNTQLGHRYRFARMLFSLRRSLLQEVDYRIEADNAIRFAQNLKNFPNIHIPQPFPEYSTDKVLTLQFIQGIKLTCLDEAHRHNLDGEGLARELFQCYLHQVLVDGFFHADPHPGNLFLTPDNRIALIDFGMVVNVPDNVKHGLIKLILALTEAHGNDVADVAIEMGREEKGFDRSAFRERVSQLVADYGYASVSRIPTGQVVLKLQAIGGDCNLLLPVEITMLGKVLLNLDRIIEVLCPRLLPREEMQRYILQVVQHQSMNMMTLERAFRSFLEAAELAENLPYRLNKFSQALADNQLKFRVETIDEKKFLSGLEKIANRVTTGLILAGLIIGASMVIQQDRPPFTYLAWIFFILASLGGLYLIVQSLRSDE